MIDPVDRAVRAIARRNSYALRRPTSRSTAGSPGDLQRFDRTAAASVRD